MCSLDSVFATSCIKQAHWHDMMALVHPEEWRHFRCAESLRAAALWAEVIEDAEQQLTTLLPSVFWEDGILSLHPNAQRILSGYGFNDHPPVDQWLQHVADAQAETERGLVA
jgi:hypothetical protein